MNEIKILWGTVVCEIWLCTNVCPNKNIIINLIARIDFYLTVQCLIMTAFLFTISPRYKVILGIQTFIILISFLYIWQKVINERRSHKSNVVSIKDFQMHSIQWNRMLGSDKKKSYPIHFDGISIILTVGNGKQNHMSKHLLNQTSNLTKRILPKHIMLSSDKMLRDPFYSWANGQSFNDFYWEVSVNVREPLA